MAFISGKLILELKKLAAVGLRSYNGICIFFVGKQEKKSNFLKKSFLLADISRNIVLDISFLTLSNVKIDFTN